MFQTIEAFSSFAVNDLTEARKFYGETLGMKVSGASSRREGSTADDVEDLLRLHIGNDQWILVYAKPDHTPASFTILNLPVKDIDAVVDELTRRGVTFERYEGMSFDDKGIHYGDVHPVAPVAWFKDPA